MEFTVSELRNFYVKLTTVLNSTDELGFDVVYALAKTKNHIKTKVEEIDEMLTSLQKEELKLNIKFCDKDADGKPIIENGSYKGLDYGINSEYDTLITEFINKKIEYLKSKEEVKIHYIDKEKIPQKGKTNLLEILCYFIKDINES